MSRDADAIVIGAGLGGLTAARELRRRGHSVLVLEARERIGGRLWTTEFAGREVELGGGYVHWFQPHVFAEMTRLGIDYEHGPHFEEWWWWNGDDLNKDSAEDVVARLDELFARVFHDARATYPKPFDVFAGGEAFAANDVVSLAQRLDDVGLTADERTMLGSHAGTLNSAYSHEAALTAVMHWYALSDCSFRLMLDAVGMYVMRTTAKLVDGIAEEADADLRLGAPVAAVDADDGGVAVTTRDGARFTAGAAVVAVPLNTLGAIRFAGPSTGGLRDAHAVTQASHGLKTWIEIRGALAPLVVSAPEAAALTSIETVYEVPDGQILLGFGPDAAKLDPTDREAVAAVVHRLVPGDFEVVAVAGHDWTADEFSRGTWCITRPGQRLGRLRGLQTRHGRIMLAGSDVAGGWNGFMDGAIESGQRVGREIATLLEADGAVV
ncbi:MAG TPA: NAD(P)/FAD-dependent oxidoreductase [Baekduia sp.]|uniref:flavin monoamine oxidase family protein n=1 Tax=Baekduia sp. TaxID=2600305 RepID=UPI002D793069|nr:NAD(P)/FAD-dependent oxidoreductase [Baekduia sp.]HET6509132.1 NAD(P)/FAD-dependent oxidoreductase [Baekduia sp.]